MVERSTETPAISLMCIDIQCCKCYPWHKGQTLEPATEKNWTGSSLHLQKEAFRRSPIPNL